MLQTLRTLNLLLLLVVMAQTARTQEANAEKYSPGLIVISVDKDSVAEKAGLKPGDLLLSLDGKALRFASQLSPMRDKARWDGKKTLAMTVRRGAEALTLPLTVAPLIGLSVRPPLPSASEKLYDEAMALPKEQFALALSKVKAAAEVSEKEGDARAAAWLWFEVYSSALNGSKEEQEALNPTLNFAEKAGDALLATASLTHLGNVARERGKLDEAEGYYKRDLAITQHLAPNSLGLADTLNNLGNVASDRGKLDEAEDKFQRAWQIVRSQGKQVAGDSGRQEFGQAYASYAANLLLTQLKNHRPSAAFVTLEEGRSQALVQVMAERGITEKVTPPEVWRPYQATETAHNVALKDAERASSLVENAKAQLKDLGERKADRATLQQKQQEMDAAEKAFEVKRSEEVRTRGEMESAWAAVRRANKAALPPPIDLKEARKRLPSGTLFLEFSVGEKKITLFVISNEYEQAFPLTAPLGDLEQELALVRQGISGDAEVRGSKADNPGNRLSGQPISGILRTLFKQLFPSEVQTAMQKAKRIVLSPDDFLWDLPFAALVTNQKGTPTYLGLQKPLSYAQSLTLFFTPGPVNATPGSGILAIGNPVYDYARRKEMASSAPQKAKPTPNAKPPVKLASTRRSGELGMMTRNGDAPDQLEYAEQEAKAVSGLYHTGAHVGIEPTEAWFRAHAGQAKILHLATHGFFNPFSPQSSGILLAVPEKTPPDGQYDNDGTLQAWEVWTLKLHAELVILSACETGRGAKVTGEGLIGLTRAWQYAGAKTIVSSQWKVSDESTSALMVAFHKHLLAGVERDEALRLAMVEVASSPKRGWSSPHQWAAFLMVGETGKMR